MHFTNRIQNINKKLAVIALILIAAIGFNSCTEDNFTDWKALNDKAMQDLQADPSLLHTESGISYKILHQGELRYPNSGSVVNVTYTGWLVDGTKFDSGTYYNYLSSSIKGWQEILTKMRGGAHFIVYIPQDLSYAETGSTDGAIPPYSMLKFDIYLNNSEN